MTQHRNGFGKLNRRQLLLATGLGSASLFLPSLGRRVHSQDAARIKRLVILTQQHGTVADSWRMLRNNTDYGNWEYPFDDPNPDSFSEILRPLHPHRQDLLVLEGLSQASTLGDRAINNHNAGHLHALTGARMVDDQSAGGASVDQIIAASVAQPGRISSLEMATLSYIFIGGMVNTGPSQRAPIQTDPRAVFQRLFPTGNMVNQAAPGERDLIRAQKSSVLDFVGQEYEAVAPRLGSEDRARLEMHRELVRDLELRVDSIASLDCAAPTEPSPTTNQIELTRQFIDLTAASFACDLTRVVTIQVGQLANFEFGAPPGDVHQDFAHQQFTDPNAALQMTHYNTAHAELLAYLLDALARYTEADGTLLDNTAVLWISELANGPHELDRIPIVMAGSCGGYFRTGRYLSHALDQPNPHEFPSWGEGATRPIGPGHSHVLISLMQAMGLPNNEIGLSSVVTRDGTNRMVDLTGPLPRLT